MELTFFSSVGWESWDVEARPAIPEGMPVLVDSTVTVFRSAIALPLSVMWCRPAAGYIPSPPFARRG